MKTIKSLKEITTLEVDDVVMFGDLKYSVKKGFGYYLNCHGKTDDEIFKVLNISKGNFIVHLGIDASFISDFPQVKSLEALTAIVSALFKEYEKQNELPKTWEEFCERNPIKSGECIIDIFSNIQATMGGKRHAKEDRNYCISEQEAEEFLALKQLRQLRKAYVKNWEPDWNDIKQYKACIMYDGTDFIIAYYQNLCSRPLSFPTYELAEQFLNNFRDLLEIAKPLL